MLGALNASYVLKMLKIKPIQSLSNLYWFMKRQHVNLRFDSATLVTIFIG